jgi:ethanolamine utilization cobalamin adenosyltransferase
MDSELLKTYFRLKGLESGADVLQSKFFPSTRSVLEERDLRLSITQRKRALGLPTSSDDYNQERSGLDKFFTHTVRQSSKHGLEALKPKYIPFSKAPTPLFDVAKGIGNTLLSTGRNIPTVRGGRYATIFGGLRSAAKLW